ncbi:MAG: hypothetical protein M3362_04565 [Acidobacteriota bacterium]|nr:hypothetical protein [Acidobacteriota bacterium]
MKRTIFIALTLLLASCAVSAQQNYTAPEVNTTVEPPVRTAEYYSLPKLHVINSITLSPSYSCRSKDDFRKGYEQTALFLSSYSKKRNSPDLLFNGACGSEDYFVAATAGDSMGLIADLGADVSVEQLSAHLAFNKQNVHSFPAYSKFAQAVKVEANHTYAVLLNSSDVRGLFIFTVTDYAPNKRVELRYAVKDYQILDLKAKSPGFSWERKNF